MTVRLTPLLRQSTTNRHLAEIKGELAHVTEAAITGMDVLRPSDAPGRWNNILDIQATLNDQSLYMDNVASAQGLLTPMDQTLGDATDVLNRATELTLQMSNEFYNDADRALVAEEVDGLREQMIGLGNTAVVDRYIFAGTAYDQPAFDSVTGAYNGNSDIPETQVGAAVMVNTGADGGAIFAQAIQVLGDLSTALRSGPGSAAATLAELDNIDAARGEVINARVRVGFDQSAAEDMGQVAENLEIVLQESLNAEIEADPVATYTRLSELQNTYEAALQVSASENSRSNLFAFMR